MADTTVLSAAQITTLADTGAVKTTVPAVAKTCRNIHTSWKFYYPDAAPFILRLQIQSNEYFEDVRLVDVSGAGSLNAITLAERTTLMAILDKLFVGRVLP